MSYSSASAVLAALALSACSAPATRGRSLALHARTSQPAVDLKQSKVIAKNALAYHVALSESSMVSIELTTQFEMVVRDLPGHRPKKQARRIVLDTPTYDILDLVLSPDGQTAYVASAAGWVRAYSVEQGDLAFEWRMGSAVSALAITEEGDYLLIGSDQGTICLRRLRDGAQLQCMIAHDSRIGALAVNQGVLASASWQGELALWSIPSLEERGRIQGRGSIAALAFAPDGASLALARNLHAPVRSQEIADKERKGLKIYDSGDNQIEIWRLPESRLPPSPQQRLSGHRSLITSIARNASDLISVSWDGTVRLWNIESGQELKSLEGFHHLLSDVALTSTGGRVAVAAWAPTQDAIAIAWLALLFSSP